MYYLTIKIFVHVCTRVTEVSVILQVVMCVTQAPCNATCLRINGYAPFIGKLPGYSTIVDL